LVGISLRMSCWVRNYHRVVKKPIGNITKLARNSINQRRTTRAASTGALPRALPWTQRCMRVNLSPWVRRSALTGAQL